MKLAKLFLFLTMVAISQPLYSQSTNSATGGRYVLTSTTSGQYAETTLLDNQTGRVWIQRGQATDHPFFIPCTFQLLDGRTSLIPIDEETELLCLQIFCNAPTNFPGRPTPVLELEKLQHDLYYTDALERFWLLQLKHMKQVDPIL